MRNILIVFLLLHLSVAYSQVNDLKTIFKLYNTSEDSIAYKLKQFNCAYSDESDKTKVYRCGSGQLIEITPDENDSTQIQYLHLSLTKTDYEKILASFPKYNLKKFSPPKKARFNEYYKNESVKITCVANDKWKIYTLVVCGLDDSPWNSYF
jgi:hypothetical protein